MKWLVELSFLNLGHIILMIADIVVLNSGIRLGICALDISHEIVNTFKAVFR